MNRITLVLGGARSGKSRFAQNLALSLSQSPIYLATSRPWDDDHRRRIERHREDRGPEWQCIEETTRLSAVVPEGRVIVVDCVTLWLTNYFVETPDIDACLAGAVAELQAISAVDSHFIFVSNELGMGVHATTEAGRKFTDLSGFFNQALAARADEVYQMTAGLPVRLKGPRLSSPQAVELPEVFRAHSARLPEPPPTSAELSAREAALSHQAQLTKPPGSLGRLEELAVDLAVYQAGNPSVRPAAALHFAADHPVCSQGIAPYPQEVTRAMVENFLSGGAASSVLCRLHGIPLIVVDVGVGAPGTSREPRECNGVSLLRAPVADLPVGDLSEEDAMQPEVFEAALLAGRAAVENLPKDTRCLLLGEMGIGNTTVAAAVCAALLPERSPAEFVGRGTGADAAILEKKRSVVTRAIARLEGESRPREVLRRVGGRELAAIFGALLAAAEKRLPVIVDGFIVTAVVLAFVLEAPTRKKGLIFAHASDEKAHRTVLDALGARPLLDLGLRLGEGTGALTAYPLVEAAVRLHLEMATFASAGVPDRAGPA